MKYKITQVYPYFTSDEIAETTDSLKSAWVTEGPKSKKFVEKILSLTGAKYGVLAPNGTLALYIALMVLDIKVGDEVIVPDFTFIASANAVYLTGAKPVFVDVLKEDLNIDTSLIEKKITQKTKAIMPVHIYGQGANMKDVMRVAKKHKLRVIEDAAQVLGVFYKNKHLGTFGDIGCFSFFADKTVSTGGEGGMVITNNKRLYEKLLYFRNQGRLHSGTFIHPRIGYNFRMTDLQCAIGLAQLRKFDAIQEAKLTHDNWYKKYLRDVSEVSFLGRSKDSTFIPFRTNMLVTKRLPELIDHMEKKGIQTRRMFYPLHKQPGYKGDGYNDKDFPNANYAYGHGLSLPVHFRLTEKDIRFICDTIKGFYAST